MKCALLGWRASPLGSARTLHQIHQSNTATRNQSNRATRKDGRRTKIGSVLVSSTLSLRRFGSARNSMGRHLSLVALFPSRLESNTLLPRMRYFRCSSSTWAHLAHVEDHTPP